MGGDASSAQAGAGTPGYNGDIVVIITAAKAGDSNYSGTEARIMLNVSKKALTVTGATAQDRQYDGTSTVTITGVTLEGIVNGDTVSVSTADLTGTLNGSNVGSYTAVTLPALTLTGGGADNYTLTRPAGAVSASVTISKAAARTPKDRRSGGCKQAGAHLHLRSGRSAARSARRHELWQQRRYL